MGFRDVLNSLLGNEQSPSPDDPGFTSTPDSAGINFYLDSAEFAALRRGQGTVLRKAQLIALRMLEEQGFAEPIANGYHIASEDLAGLDDEAAEVLQLPPRFDGRFGANISGRTGNSGFRVELSAMTKEGNAPFERHGPLLALTSTEQYRLTPGELMGLQAWEKHQGLWPEERGEAANVRLMAELQTAERSGMSIDLGAFKRLDLVVPKSIGVTATRLPDGSLTLCPSLGDGSTPDQLEKRWPQLDVDSDGGVLRINNRVVLLEPQKMAAIKEVLGNQRIPAEKVSEFIASPSAFLDAALVNLEMGFSVRVMGVGTLQHVQFGELDARKQDWFSLDARLAPTEIIQKLVQSPEDLEHFQEVYAAASEQGAQSLSFAGEQIDISNPEAVAQQLSAARDAIDRLADESNSDAAPEPVEETATVSVLIQDAEEVVSSLLTKASEAHAAAAANWGAYARQPYPHQREGVDWMMGLLDTALADDPKDPYRLQGGLLADDMGLGKTYMSLVTVAEYLARQKSTSRPQKPILVVAPLSLLENWEDEVSKTFKSIPFRDVVVLQAGRDLNGFRVKGAERESSQKAGLIDDAGHLDTQAIRFALNTGPEAGARRLDMDRRLVLATYQTLRDYQFSLCRIDWGMVIFDEAQNIKNPNALQTVAAKGLKADFKLLATGTPVENSLADFWCLMDTAQPGLLGDWKRFREQWIKPILSAPDDQRDETRRQIGHDLRKAVGAFMLRRVKEDQLKDLPAKTIHAGAPQTEVGQICVAPELSAMMKGRQLQAYDAALDDFRSQRAVDDMRGKAFSVLRELRRISLHPDLCNPSALRASSAAEARQKMMISGKMEVLLRQLDAIRLSGEKVILFMETKSLQRCLALWLNQIYDLDIAIINGDTAAVSKRSDVLTRKQYIAEFEAKPGFNLIIMSPVAAGVGLTVIGANHVIHLERHWNPAKEAQASDRVYRIGQKKEVHVYLPAVLHPQFASFDVHLDRLLRGKLMLKDAVVTPEGVNDNEIIQSMGLNGGSE